MNLKPLSRRKLLRSGLVAGAGTLGLAALAGCGETEVVEVIKEVPVEKIVTQIVERVVREEKIVTVIVEAPKPQAVNLVFFDYVWVDIDKVRDLIIDNYKTLNPHVSVEYVKIPWGDYTVKILTSIAGGSPGDVMYNHPELTATFAAKGALAPLNEFIKGDSRIDLDDFNDGLVEANTIGGKIYSLPTFSGPWMFVYNRNLVDPLGLGDPWELYQAGEWTIDKYREMALAAVGGEGQDQVFGTNEIPSAMKLIYLWAWGYGGTVWDNHLAPTAFVGNSPESVNAWEYATGLLHDGIAPPREFASNFPGGNQALLFSNKIAIYQSHRQFFGKITDDEIDPVLVPMHKMPNGDDQSRDAPEGYGVFSGTKVPEAAWDLTSYIATEGVKVHIALGFSGPTLKSLWDSDLFKNSLKSWENIDAYIAAFKGLKQQFTQPAGYNEMNSLFGAAYDEIVLKNKTAKEAMDDVKPKIDAILAENQ
jgi:ABC-type glycerol-3-phosphate transport system substrate-binding protein